MKIQEEVMPQSKYKNIAYFVIKCTFSTLWQKSKATQSID